MSSIQGEFWQDMNSKELGQPCPYDIATCSSHGLSLGLLLLGICGFPQLKIHVPGISNFLDSPHTFEFTLTASCTAVLGIRGLVSQASLQNLRGSLPDSTTTIFCMPETTAPCE